MERRHRLGSPDDPELRPVAAPRVTGSPGALFEHLTRPADAEETEPSFKPRPAAPGAVVPVKRDDTGWYPRPMGVTG
jgi:hypothetical protein